MKGVPKEGEAIKTKQGKGKVISVNALRREVLVELDDGRQIKVVYDAPPCKREGFLKKGGPVEEKK